MLSPLDFVGNSAQKIAVLEQFRFDYLDFRNVARDQPAQTGSQTESGLVS